MKNWDKKSLGEVCDFSNGQAHEKHIDEKGKFKVINSKFISSGGEIYKMTNKALSPLFRNDIVMVMSDVPNGKTIAKCFLVDEDDTYTLNQRVCVIRSNNFDPKFLFYQINRNKYFLNFDNGENQTNLRKGDILNCSLFIPSFPEQHRIVAILDEAFAAIAKAKANAEHNLKNGKELFESYLQSVFENKLEGWEEKTLGEVSNLISGQHINTKNYNTEAKGIGYLTGPSDFGLINPIISKWTDQPKVKAKRGDILITVKGSGVGKINILNYEEVVISRQLMAIRVTGAEPGLIYLILKLNFKLLQELATGAAIPGISREQILSLKIPLPSIAEQGLIISNINALSSETNKLEAIYQKKIANLEELRKSLLQKAFSGELKTLEAISI